MSEHTINMQMYNLTCETCGIAHSIPIELYNKARQDGKSWNCPNGHSLVFSEYEADKLRRQVARLEKYFKQEKSSKDWWMNEDKKNANKIRALRGHNTRLRNKLKKKRALEGFPPLKKLRRISP